MCCCDMRSIITILLIVLFSLHSNPISAETGLGTVEDFMPMAIFDYSELGGTISGICSGESSLCVYSNSSYLIVHMDDEWDQSEKYAIDHPQIKDDAPYVRQLFLRMMPIIFWFLTTLWKKAMSSLSMKMTQNMGNCCPKKHARLLGPGTDFF